MDHYAQYNGPGDEEDDVTFFLAMTLINKITQADGCKVLHPEQGSDYNNVWNPDEEDNAK